MWFGGESDLWPAEVHKSHKPRDRQPSIAREKCVLSEWLMAIAR